MTLDELRRARPDLSDDVLEAALDLYDREQALPVGLDYSREAGLRNVVDSRSATDGYGDGVYSDVTPGAAVRSAPAGRRSKAASALYIESDDYEPISIMPPAPPAPEAEKRQAGIGDRVALGYERLKTGISKHFVDDETFAANVAGDNKLAAQYAENPDVKKITDAVAAANKDPGVASVLNVVGQAIANPSGLAHLTAENVANQLPGLAAPIAGMAAGASIAGPLGAVVGLVGGSLVGNTPEIGAKAVEMANEIAQKRGLDPTNKEQLLEIVSDPEFKDESTRQGLIKWGIISGVDALTGGVAGRVVSAPVRGLVGDVGADIAGKVVAKQALSGAEKQVVGDALERFAATQTLRSRAGRYGTAVGLETAGEIVGEGGGEYAASGEFKPGDAVLEGLIAGPQSAVTSYGLGKVQTPEAASALRDANLDYTLSTPPADETVQGEDNRVRVDLPWFREMATERISELKAKSSELDGNAQPVGLTGEEALEMKQLNAALQDPAFAEKYADSLGYQIVADGAPSQAQATIPIGTPPITLPADNNELREMVLGMSDDERADAMIGLPKADQNRFYAALPHGKNGGAAMLLRNAVEQRTTAVVNELNQLDDAHLELRARNDQNPFVSKTAAQILLDRKASGQQVAGSAAPVQKLNKAVAGLMQLNSDIDFAGLSALTPAGKDGSLLTGQVEGYIRGKREEMAVAAKQKRFDQLKAEGKLVNDHFSVVTPEELGDKPTTVEYQMGGKKYRANRITKDSFGRIQKIAGFFNREVVLVRDERPKTDSYSDGFVSSAEPNKVYLNVDAISAGHLTVVGHELAHHLEKVLGGKLYQQLSDAIDPHLNANAEDYQRRQGYAGESKDAVFKEIRADLMGNRFGKEKFWQDVFTRLEKKQPGMAKRVKDTVISWFRGVANSMQARKEYAGSEKELISQLRGAVTAVDTAYAKAVANWIKAEQGTKKPAEPAGAAEDATIQDAKGARPGSDVGHSRESSGRYVGAPDWIGDSPQQLAVLRNTLTQLAKEGEPGRFWYENSSKAILKLVNGNKADAERLVQLIAIYSPSNAVPGNTTMALKAFYQWKAGVPIRVGTTTVDKKANELLYGGNAWAGIKTNSFYQNLMEEIDPSKNDADAATMDMWMAMAFNYGSISVDQGPKYKFMEREIQRVAKQFGWRPHQVQAAIWTAMKGRVDTIRADITAEELDRGWHNGEAQQWWSDNRSDFMTRRTKHKIDVANGKDVAALTIKAAGIDTLSKGREKDHYRLAFEMAMKNDARGVAAAKYDFSDAINQRVAQISWEAAPGASTGILPGYHSAPISEQLEYLAMVRAALTDADGNDIIGKRVGLLIGQSIKGFSGWDGAASVGIQDGVAVPINTQDGGIVQQVARDAINLVADIRGLVLHQEGVAWHYPIYRSPAYAQNGIEFNIGRQLTEKENADLYRAISDELGHTFSPPIPTADGQGFRVLNFPDEKFALMDEQLSNDVDTDLLGDTGKSIKGKLQSSERKKNEAFREAVRKAVSKQAWHGEVGDVTLFSSDGELRTNDWSNGDRDYRGRIEAAHGALGVAGEAGRAEPSDLLKWIDDELRPAIAAVNRQAARKFGWEYNGELDLGRPDAAGRGRDRGVGDGRSGEVQRSAIREYGAPTEGSVSAVGVHYSTQPRESLSGAYYGTGIAGAERDRVFSANDRRLRNRIHFYIDGGQGVFPEAGVGAHRHEVRLNNLYDANADVRIQRTVDRSLSGGEWLSAFESAVIDAGHDGYVVDFGRQRAAVLIGDHTVNVTPPANIQRSVIHQLTLHPLGRDERIITNDIPAGLVTPHQKTLYLKKLTKENAPIIDDVISDIKRNFGVVEAKPNEKEFAKIIEKAKRPSIVEEKPWHGVEHIRDSYRFKAVLSDYADLPGIVQLLLKRGITFAKVDLPKVLFPKEYGFRIASFDMKMPNGQLIEFYTPVAEVEEVKAVNHLIFERWRNIPNAAMSEQMKALRRADIIDSYRRYRAAFDSALARTQSTESDVLASLFKVAASFGGTSPNDSNKSTASKTSPATQRSSIRQATKPGVSDSAMKTLERSSVASTSMGASYIDGEIVPADSTAGTAVQQSLMRDDAAAQAEWLNAEAVTRGFADIDALLASDARTFFSLAEQWRTAHPEDELTEEPVTQHSVLRWMSEEQRSWKDSGLIPAEKMAKYVSAISAVIDAVKSGDKLIGETVPLTPVPAVLRMANAPSQWITASMNIAHKMFGDPNNTQHDDNRVGKHREDFVNLTAADVMGMFADPLVVIQSPRGPSQFEIITGKMGAKGPIMFAITIDAQPVAGKRDRMTVIRSGYSLTPSQISSKIMDGKVLYAKSAEEVDAMYGDAVSLHDAYQRGEEERWFKEGPGIAPGKGRPHLPPGPKNRLTGQSVKTEADKIKWIEQRKTAAGTAVQRSAMRQTETPEFKAWFGDSKVVDAEGNPLVVYHATGHSFDVFDTNRSELGSHFGTIEQAEQIAGVKDSASEMPVYLSIKNPLRLEDYGSFDAQAVAAQLADLGLMTQAEADAIHKAVNDEGVPEAKLTAKLKQAIRRGGYDGVVYLNRREGFDPFGPDGVTGDALNAMSDEEVMEWFPEAQDSWIAFRPTQIKSAIGNRGTFDPTNPDITKSALREQAADAMMNATIPTAVGRAVRDRISDAVRGSSSFNPLHRTVATQLHKARINPEFGKVFDLGQKVLDYTAMFAMRSQEKAPRILPDLGNLTLRNLTPKGWKEMAGLNDADNEAVGQLLAEGTLFNGANPHTGKVFTDQELTAKGMTGPQIDAYRQARAAIDQTLDDSAKALLISFARQAGVSAEDLDAFAEIDLSLRNVHQAIVSELNALGKTKAVKDANNVVWEAESLKRHGYAPLMRFGQHTVRVLDAAGETVWFSMHESKADALRTRSKVASLGTAVTVGELNPIQFQMYQSVSPGLIESFAKHIPLNSAAEREAMQDYLRMTTTQRSTMQRMMKREGIAGYSNDATRVLAHYVTSAGRQNAKLIVDTRLNNAVMDIADGGTQAEAQKLVEYLRNPQEGAAKIRGFLFFNFLGGSIAAGIVNMTQPVMMTFPFLSQYGVGRAGAAMSSGLRATSQWFKSRRVSDPDLHVAMQQAHDQGIIEPQEIFQMMAAAETGTSSILGHKLMRLWGMNFALTEAFNRTLTFAAAYQIGKDRALSAGLTGTAASGDAFHFAVRAVEDTQGLYNKGNRPNWARESGALGVVGTLAFTFKQYSIAYVEMLKRLYDAGPDGKKAALMALGILVLASGLGGLPFADDLDDAIETLAAWMGKPINMRREKREAILSAMKMIGFGEDAADFLMVGASEFLPVDVQARLGLHNMIPGTSLMNPMRQSSVSEIMEPLGPLGGVVANAMKSAKAVAGGDVRGAVMPMLPKALGDFAKGSEMAATGEYRDQQGRLVSKASPVDAVAKMIGFNPADFAERSRAMKELRTDQEAVQYMQDTYNKLMARSVVERKAELRDKAQQLLRDWNREYPELRIKSDMGAIMRRVRTMQMTQTERFIKATPKAQRQMAQQALNE